MYSNSFGYSSAKLLYIANPSPILATTETRGSGSSINLCISASSSLQRFVWLSAFSLFTAVLSPIAFATSLEPWYDMKVKHTWNSVPVNWENKRHPPDGALITPDNTLKPEKEIALVDALTEVSNPKHSRNVLLSTHPFAPVFTCASAP